MEVGTLVNCVESHFSAVFKSIPAPIIIFRQADCSILYANEHYYSTFGIIKDNFVTPNALDFSYNQCEISRLVGACDKEGVVRNVELSFNYIDGTQRRVVASFQLESFNAEAIVVAILHDVSDRPPTAVKRKQTLLNNLDSAWRRESPPLSSLMSDVLGTIYRKRNDAEWTIEYISEGCYPLTGYSPDELVGDGKIAYTQLIHPEDRESVLEQMQAALAQRQPFQLCYRLIAASKEEKWVWEQGQGIFAQSGELLALEGFITDITLPKRAEEETRLLQIISQAIAESDNFDSVLEVALSKVCEATGWSYGEAWVPRADGRGIECSPAWYSNSPLLQPFRQMSEEWMFLPDTGLIGRVWSSKQPEWIPDVSSSDIEVFCRNPFAQECQLKAAFGVPIVSRGKVLAVLAFFIFEARPKDERLVKLVSCVAAQLGHVIECKLAEAKYRSIFDNASEGIFQTTPNGRFLSVNPALAQIYGYSSPEELLESITDIENQVYVNPYRRNEFLNLLKEQGSVSKFEYQIRRKDGSTRWISKNARAVRDRKGKLLYCEGTVEDITTRKQAEIEIRKAMEKEKELAELKSRFLAIASHELRTPLATILIAADLLRSYSHQLSQEKKEKQFDKIHQSVKKMALLLDDVLSLEQSESGTVQFNPISLDLQLFCQEILEEIAIAFGSKHQFKFSFVGSTSRAEMDEKLIRQLLGNLLSNAVKYSPQGGEVKFTVVCQDGQAVFEISDQGIGIPEADKERLFEAFNRGSNVRGIPGTGLGLAIIKNAVDLHQGTITVSSEVGVGTTFTVCLPLNTIV